MIEELDYKIHPSCYIAIRTNFLIPYAKAHSISPFDALYKIYYNIYHNSRLPNFAIIRPDALAYTIHNLSNYSNYNKEELIRINLYDRQELYTLVKKFLHAYTKYDHFSPNDLDYIIFNQRFLASYAKEYKTDLIDAETYYETLLYEWDELPAQKQYIISKNIIINPEKLAKIIKQYKITEELILLHIKYKPSIKILNAVLSWLGFVA
ncbi:MAG: hypothetical protein ACP5IZ_11790 [Thermoprotei archaeon]|jgi:hypothetical protein